MPAVAEDRQTTAAPREYGHTPPEYRISACEADEPRRREAEAFVRERFLRSHGAQVTTFMPTLLLLTDSSGELAAVAGYRNAAIEPLYLEKYLSVPVERSIASQIDRHVKRSEIVEVGNFAARNSHRAKVLMSFMPSYFLECPARWIVFTATSAIRGMLLALGGSCVELGTADGACVAGGADDWGRYYSRDPRVMAGFLPSARRIPALWRSHHGN
jgi:hypothetical protein